jgi:TRAP-type C4-dicarboxylate transport system substrate-binding protein
MLRAGIAEATGMLTWNTKTWRHRAATVGILVVALAACVPGSGGAVDKAGGGAAGVVTLTAGLSDPPGRLNGDALEYFASQVRSASGGALQIRIDWQAQGPGATRFDQKVAQLVFDGTLDLGLIPARAWDALGVTSLRALQAPFLVDSDSLVDAIVSGVLADELMSGVSARDVTGLALFPEDLRHPVGFGRAFLSPADFAGQRIRAPYSQATSDLLAALGATAVDLDGSAADQAVATGSVTGAESALELLGTLPAPGTLTANVTFFPKVNVLVVRNRVLDRLSTEERAELGKAARATREHMMAAATSDPDKAEAACSNGDTVVLADASQVRALGAAVQPIYAALERDPQTAGLIHEIQALKAGLPAPPATIPCQPPSGPASPASSTAGPAARIPDGLYRKAVTTAELVAAGVPAAQAYYVGGIQDLVLTNGQFLQRPHADESGASDCRGTYATDGDTVTFTAGPAPACGVDSGKILFTASWASGDGELRLSMFTPDDPWDRAFWGGQPWKKTG